jgi:hypothetical protein
VLYRLLADALVVIHGTFIIFVVAGGLLALRWPRALWAHAPAAVWGALIELAGWICPLTPLENELRRRGGEAGYSGGFVEHYLLPLIYPAELTRMTQLVLGALVVAVNVTVYAVVIRRRQRPIQPPDPGASPPAAARGETRDRAGRRRRS